MTIHDMFDAMSLYVVSMDYPVDTELIIDLKDPSTGPRASVGITCLTAEPSFDHGKLRICPETALYRNIKRLDSPCGAYPESIGGRIHYHCEMCRMPVSRSDLYCRHCGQRLR